LFVFVSEDALFKFDANRPSIDALLQLPPRLKTRSLLFALKVTLLLS
jgi:hypothetical protein